MNSRILELSRRGYSLVEVLTLLVLLLAVFLFTLISYSRIGNANVVKVAAREFSSLIYLYRYKAVRERRSFGIKFQQTKTGYSYRVYGDGDDDGIRQRDIEEGVEELVEGPYVFGDKHHGARPLIPEPWPVPAPPPSREGIKKPWDAVKFGAYDTLVITPRGTSNGGSIYISDGEERLWAVVIMGSTMRLRLWEYDRGVGKWIRR